MNPSSKAIRKALLDSSIAQIHFLANTPKRLAFFGDRETEYQGNDLDDLASKMGVRSQSRCTSDLVDHNLFIERLMDVICG